jgi:hypothetical protein
VHCTMFCLKLVTLVVRNENKIEITIVKLESKQLAFVIT